MSGEIHWRWCTFEKLGPYDLYDILALRQAVFIIEQQCVFPDADGRDHEAWHLLGRSPEGTLAAYLRALPPRHPEGHPSLGRVVVHPRFRGSGLGRLLVEEGLRMIGECYPKRRVHIAAQRVVESFYVRMGFVREGEPYQEDGIVHVAMVRPST